MNKRQLLLELNNLEHWLADGSDEARLGLEEGITALKEKIKAESTCPESEDGSHHWLAKCVDCGICLDENGIIPNTEGVNLQPEPQVLTSGWARRCAQYPESWEFFNWKAPRSRRVHIVAVER